MPKNKLSQPVKSKVGYHLIVVNKRKKGKKLSDQTLIIKARTRLAFVKMENLLRKWLKESKIDVDI